ncbi:MAG: glycoside hydrolase, partial [Proteiniphilum sp.]|nr:glycoside hydrolase [Proteiniphilum sp.]MDD4800794.1 glycoside hydrolase [Proteiniphilum sp.]
MKMIMKLTKVLLLCPVFLLAGCSGSKTVEIKNLRTEYRVEPLGVESAMPRFTWEYQGDDPNFKEKKHMIYIGTDPEHLQPCDTFQDFESHTRYYWRVKVWNGDHREPILSDIASFETGKLHESDWVAKWITDHNPKEFEPAPMFRREFSADKKVAQA